MLTSGHRIVALAIALGCASGCDSSGNLDGVMGDVDLNFDAIRGYWMRSDLVVIYEDELEPSEPTMGAIVKNQIARLTFDTVVKPLEANKEIAFENDDLHRGAFKIERYVLEDEGLGGLVQQPDFPELIRAVASFDKIGTKEGEQLVGKFHCEFVNNLRLDGDFDIDLKAP